jgi:hypothetical protein
MEVALFANPPDSSIRKQFQFKVEQRYCSKRSQYRLKFDG